MKKLGIFAIMLAVLGSAVVGCEPAKKKTDAPKSTEPAPAAGEAKPADAAPPVAAEPAGEAPK